MDLRTQDRWRGKPLRCVRVVPWSRGPVWPPSGPVPHPQPGCAHSSQDPESVARENPSVCPRGLVVPWSRGPVAPWFRGLVWPPSGPAPRPQPGLGCGSQDPESVARWPRSVCWLGPVVPWSRLAPVWPRASSPAWLRLVVPGSRIGGSVAPFGVLAWSRGPVVPSGLSLSSSLSLLFGVHAPVSCSRGVP